jgi:hypothetical protein
LLPEHSYAGRDHSTQGIDEFAGHAKTRALFSALLFPRYFTLAVELLQISHSMSLLS